MHKEGDEIEARVTRIEQYGVYLVGDGVTVILLLPDAVPPGKAELRDIFKVGDKVPVRLGRYSSEDSAFRGFLRPPNCVR